MQTLNLLIIYIQGLCQPAYVQSDQTLVYTGGCQVYIHIYFQIEFVLTIIREIVQALHILHITYITLASKGFC